MYLKEISENYIEYIHQINLKRKSSSKDFYIIIEYKNNNKKEITDNEEIIKNDLREKYFKIKECLSRCGNYVEEINSKEKIEKLFFSILNINENSNLKFNKIIK